MHTVLRSLIEPAGLEAKAVTPARREPQLFGIEGRIQSRLSNRSAPRHTGAYGGADAIDWVMDCVDLYAQTASNATYHFAKDGRILLPDKTPADPDTVGEAPQDLAALFERPNRISDYTELIELTVIDLLLAGEFFWYKHRINAEGKPDELYRISPALIEVIPGQTAPKGYVYHPPGGGEPISWRPQQVLHVKRPNPHDPWRGLGVIAGGPRMYDLELALTDQMARYYEEGTRPSGILESERSITPSSWEKIKAQFRALYQGSANAHEVIALERGLKFRPVSANAVESEFANISEWSRDRICSAFRVPTPLIGVVGGSTDRQAVREAQRIFDNKTMRPFLNRLQSMISTGLTSAWDDIEYVIDHEYVMPIEDRLDLAETLATLPGIRVREVRDQVDLDPLGDERDDIVLNLPGEDREDGGFPDQPIGDEPGRPAKPQNTKPFPDAGDPLPPGADASQKALAVRRRIRQMRHVLRDMENG